MGFRAQLSLLFSPFSFRLKIELAWHKHDTWQLQWYEGTHTYRVANQNLSFYYNVQLFRVDTHSPDWVAAVIKI